MNTVRPALVSDALRIGEIHVAGWRAAYCGIMPDEFLAGLSVEKRAAGWRIAIERDPRGLFVCERDGVIIGWVALGQDREKRANVGEIFALYVDPARWRNGCGRMLMQAAEAELWSRGNHSPILWVLERNHPARTFYERLSYADDGGRKSEKLGEVDLVEIRMSRNRRGS